MLIQKINLSPYELNLKREFNNSRETFIKKNGFIIKILTSNFTGYGEVAYLEGFSEEGFRDINWGFQSFKQSINLLEEYSIEELLVLVEIHTSNLPSLQFGLETALYDIKSKTSNLSIAQFLNNESKSKIEISTIYNNQLDLQSIKHYKFSKYKLGIRPIDDDILILNKIVESTNNGICFRFDANQAFSVKDFLMVFKKIKHFKIDYFEEPIKNPDIFKLEEIKGTCNIQIAVDESIYNKNYKKWAESNLIDVLIIKPSIYGGYQSFFNLYKFSQENNLRFILSSAIESSIGNMATIQLAATLKEDDAHGLNIHQFYDTFTYQPIYNNEQSIINLDDIEGLGINS